MGPGKKNQHSIPVLLQQQEMGLFNALLFNALPRQRTAIRTVPFLEKGKKILLKVH